MKTKLTKTKLFSSLNCLPINKEGHYDKENFATQFEKETICPHCDKSFAIKNDGFRQNNKRLGHCPECEGYFEISYEMKVVTEITFEVKRLLVDAPNSVKLLKKLEEDHKEDSEN